MQLQPSREVTPLLRILSDLQLPILKHNMVQPVKNGPGFNAVVQKQDNKAPFQYVTKRGTKRNITRLANFVELCITLEISYTLSSLDNTFNATMLYVILVMPCLNYNSRSIRLQCLLE